MPVWGMLLGLLIVLFFVRPMTGDFGTIFKTIIIMGLVGTALKIISFNTISDWASGANRAIGATAVAGALVLVGLNFAIQQADIPFIPDNVEKIIRYVFYAMGGVLMVGSVDWTQLFTDIVGLINGGGGGGLGILKDILNILTLGLSGQ